MAGRTGRQAGREDAATSSRRTAHALLGEGTGMNGMKVWGINFGEGKLFDSACTPPELAADSYFDNVGRVGNSVEVQQHAPRQGESRVAHRLALDGASWRVSSRPLRPVAMGPWFSILRIGTAHASVARHRFRLAQHRHSTATFCYSGGETARL